MVFYKNSLCVFLLCISFSVLGVDDSFLKKTTPYYNTIWQFIDEGDIQKAKDFVSTGKHIKARLVIANNATPLHWAVFRNRIEMVQLFIENGLYVDIKDGIGATPFHWSVWHENKKMMEYLISKRANIHAVPDSGDSLLVFAIRVENYLIAEFLIQKGVDINKPDSWKKTTALHEACARRKPNRDFIRILLSHKADTNKRDSYNCLPRDLLDGKYPEIQMLFDKYKDPPCRSFSCWRKDMICQSYSLF